MGTSTSSSPANDHGQLINTINSQIAALEHSASIANLKARNCEQTAKEHIAVKCIATAKEHFAHSKGYRGQHQNLLKAISALHTQRLTLDAEQTNLLVMTTFKKTASQQFNHPLIDPAEVDRITEAMHNRGDRVHEDTEQIGTIGGVQSANDAEFEAFLQECAPLTPTVHSAIHPSLHDFRTAAGTPVFPTLPATTLVVPNSGQQTNTGKLTSQQVASVVMTV